MLVKIEKILGSQGLLDWIEEASIEVEDKDSLKSVLGKHPEKDLQKLVNAKNTHLATADAVSLVRSLLQYDPTKRLSAKEAMAHPYFEGL